MKDWLREETQKLSGMTAGKKAEYIWQYYKLWLIGAAALVAFVIYLTVNFISANRDTQLYVSFVNTNAEVGNGSALWKGYVSETGADTSKVNIDFDAELYFDMSKKSVTGNHYYEKLVVLIDSGTDDAVVMSEDNIKAFGAKGRLLSLDDERAASIAQKYADRIRTTTVTDEDGSTREVPVAIDISDSRIVTQAGAYRDEGCALGISAYSTRVDEVERFLDYVLQEDAS